MPTKEGLPLIAVWQSLGIDWSHLTLPQVQQILEVTGIGFVYLPRHFPQAQHLVTYREEIGKRPPFATLELMWCPYAGAAEVISGFVHPPTEMMMREAYQLRQGGSLTTIKGLEGSCDLPRERTVIVGFSHSQSSLYERLCLRPKDYKVGGKNADLETFTPEIMQTVLRGEPSELMLSVLWNTGFYLWRSGVSPDITAGMAKAESLLREQLVQKKLTELKIAIDSFGKEDKPL
jgi:anthranilate phosphoribosyltransferase